jgi:hypothetical protein
MTTTKTFRWIRLGGLLTLIPIVLATGPLTGYLAGEWLVLKFGFHRYTAYVCVIIGFAAAIGEIVKIIKAALKIAGENG